MNHQSKLFANGLKPVYKVEGQMKNYKRIPGDLNFAVFSYDCNEYRPIVMVFP